MLNAILMPSGFMRMIIIMYIKWCSNLFNSQKSKFRNESYFCKYCHNGLELKNYSINIMIRDVWKLKDNK